MERRAVPATFTVTSVSDAPDANPADGVADFDLIKPGIQASLRAAIQQANATPGPDSIHFAIGSGGAATIRPRSPLPEVTDRVLLDGSTQPGFIGRPLVELDGIYAGPAADGLRLRSSAGGSTVRGLVINRFGSDGIELVGGSDNVIQANYLGTDLTGTRDLGNRYYGVYVNGGANNLVGGTGSTSTRNVISGNDGTGVAIRGGTATLNRVVGNFIGTSSTGQSALGNGTGVVIDNAPNNQIGDVTPGAANVISGNGGDGVNIRGTTGTDNRVVGNRIGTDPTGLRAVGNFHGVLVNGAAFNLISDNMISGNRGSGVVLMGETTTATRVLRNSIGTDAWSLGARVTFGNAGHGLYITNNASRNRIGLISSSDGNTIAFNGGDGIYVESGTRNAILSNRIYSNAGLGIDLGPDGVTANDNSDADSGANDLQNAPVLDGAYEPFGSIAGHLRSTPYTTFTIQFYANPPGLDEGQILLGSVSVTTDWTGFAQFLGTMGDGVIHRGDGITATATQDASNYSGSTSEFSRAIEANNFS
jgi:hypothetical protein